MTSDLNRLLVKECDRTRLCGPLLTKFSCWGGAGGLTLSTSDTINQAEEFKVA